MGMSILGVILFTGSLTWSGSLITRFPHGWNIWFQPLAFCCS